MGSALLLLSTKHSTELVRLPDCYFNLHKSGQQGMSALVTVNTDDLRTVNTGDLQDPAIVLTMD